VESGTTSVPTARRAAGKGVETMTEQPETTARKEKGQEYEPPEVRTEEVFETLALACTKVAVGQCPPTPGETVARS
jgi:hypothetical protein